MHPTLWARIVTWFFTTFTASSIKEKVHFLSGIQYLYDWIDPDQLEIPAFVLEYDMKVNTCLPDNTVRLHFIFTYHLVRRSFFVFFTIRKMEIITTLLPVRIAREVYKGMLKGMKCQIYQ